MDSKKKYYNAELSEILKIYLTEEKYGEFVPLLEEIFQRRAYEFDFDERIIEEEVLNFVKNVESIKFVTSKEIGKDTYNGLYRPSTKQILLNQDYFLTSEKTPEALGEEIFETLTHEVYHGINDFYENYKRSGLASYDKEGKIKGAALDEVFVEVAADRATISRTLDDQERYRTRTVAYTDITFVPNLLATSVGLTEKEILSEGLQERWSLLEVLGCKFSSEETAEKAEKEFIEPFEISLDTIYNILYDKSNEQADMKKALLIDSLKSLYSNIYGLMNFQIEDETRDITDYYASEVIFRLKKIERILEDSLKEFKDGGLLLLADVKGIKDSLASQRRKLILKAAGISMMAEYREKLEEEEYENLVLEVRAGKFKNVKSILREKYGVSVPEISLAKIMGKDDSEYRNYIMQEDFDNGLQWDNTEVSKLMIGLLRKSISDKAKEETVNPEENINRNDSSSDVKASIARQTIRIFNGETLLQNTTQEKRNWFSNFLKKMKGLIFRKNEVKLLDAPRDTEKIVEPINKFDQYEVPKDELKPLKMWGNGKTNEIKREREEK